MRITESQLRKIVRRMVNEQTMDPPMAVQPAAPPAAPRRGPDPATTAAITKAVEMAKGITPDLLDSEDELERSHVDDIIEGICRMLRDLPKFRNNPDAVYNALVKKGVDDYVADAITEVFGDYHSNDPHDPTSPEEPGYFGY